MTEHIHNSPPIPAAEEWTSQPGLLVRQPEPTSPEPQDEDIRLDNVDDAEATSTSTAPSWLIWLCGLALLLMANQIKLPIAGGRLGIADLGFAAALLGLLFHQWRNRQRVFFPLLALVALAAIALANVVSRSGLGGAMEVAQLVQQFFCGLLIMSFLVENAPRLAGLRRPLLAVNSP